MIRKSAQRVSPSARQEATEWFVLLREREVEPATREAFHEWLRRAPDNVHAYLRIIALWEDAELLGESGLFDRERLLSQARAEPANVEALRPDRLVRSEPSRRSSRLLHAAIAAAVLLMGVAVGSWTWLLGDTYVTETGEQRILTLADGSVVVLNAQSRVRVRFARDARSIDLLAGQAMFRAAHDAARPFLVHTGPATIRAVGTQFDVYRREGQAIITVIEGRISVGSSDVDEPAHPPALVDAGEQVTVATASEGAIPLAPVRADVSRATAWTQGRLIFDETPLSEVVAEFNRYSVRRLIIEDPSLLGFHVSGVFPANDPTRIANLLHQRFGVSVQENDGEIRIVRP
jgi:transmembrane sensor